MKVIFVLSVLLFFLWRGHSQPVRPRFVMMYSTKVRRLLRNFKNPLTNGPSSCKRDKPDGCSSLNIGRWENTFTSSCNKHDMCYICGGGRHHNWSRKFCDDSFKHDMRKACEQVCKSNPRRDCYHWSNIYYRAVRMGGHRSYNKNYCSESCIKSQGDPGRRITL